MHILKQSTAVDVLIGPFLDSTNAYDGETGLSPAVKLSKNGQALAAKSAGATPTHDADGYYNCELDATDTNTVGTLILTVAGSATALPVRHEYQVVEEAIYDALFGSGAAAFDSSQDVTVGGYATGQVPLQPTTAGRTLDVTAGGAAGIDWGNIENPTTVVDLAGTDINLVDTTTTNTDMRGTDGANTTAPLSAAQTKSEVVDALNADTYSEPAQGAPTATPTIREMLHYLYKSWRNAKDNDGTTTQLYDDAGTTVDHKQTTSEAAGTVTKGEWASGP